MSIEVTAVFSKLIYKSNDEMFGVAEFIDSQSARRFRATGKIGHVGKNDAAQKYKLFGEWQENSKYGTTFGVIYCEPLRPSTISGVIPFLANNIKGVGETTAKKLLAQLKVESLDDLLSLCRTNPDAIFQFFKNKKSQAQSLLTLLNGDESFRQIMVFLHEHNISARFAQKIFDRYKDDAVRLLKENPYRLISDFRNVGFLKADQIALKLGIDPSSAFRLEAAFIFALVCAGDEGHVCLPRDDLIKKAKTILNHQSPVSFETGFLLNALRSIYKKNRESQSETFVIREIISNTLSAESKSSAVEGSIEQTSSQTNSARSSNSNNSIFFYIPEYLNFENNVASYCVTLKYRSYIGNESAELKQKMENTTLESLVPQFPWSKLSDEQKNAVETSIHSRIMILTGGPGCGKTFTLKAIYAAQTACKRSIALCAPTGLAAKRMTHSIGVQSFTMHKLLKLGAKKSSEKGTADNTLENVAEVTSDDPLENVDAVIVDEASMISMDLFHTLLEALGPNRRLIIVGDRDQLPSVGPGHVLNDLIGSQEIPVARLTKIFRQTHESPIPNAARNIIQGKPIDFVCKYFDHRIPKPDSLVHISCKSDHFAEILVDFVTQTIPNIYNIHPARDCQVLVPMRRSQVGSENINRLLQKAWNPESPDKNEVELKPAIGDSLAIILREGDKVIQTRNNYEKEVYNGDLGFCKKIHKTKETLEVTIEFDDKVVTLENEEIEDLQLCYAMTIHKSQGSEFKMCILPMFSSYYSMLDRNLFYTALTRASQFAIIIGEDWSIKKAISNQSSNHRYTCLQWAIQQHSKEAKKWTQKSP